ncbi:Asp-tRNA(Asn)/Glu-tRNA(Gln) amidotransferase subunit GatC [Clostridium sp. cel8]|uniref:Asp-tRNA(Asn)/Glu-tRNA(Gln) amidotransferase subunit GatC n=1 Tax=unclassified Clostridium TaxID=2614128 RepID=UPI0015F41866|nr:Asp-tRNA(Asn)/Glu-tRNA(Gln) amidotransferase subunit GatC [Clostridium sp. cel8]MBA5850864.1 Asp-tRNA(Asn)/Glu-tRNA(Gln) amidotransferase subunit GatC [Clostridium sp. cel8]
MSISLEDVKCTAKLARLKFSEIEQNRLVEDLSEIMDYVSKLDELDVEEEEPVVNPYYIENKYREDIVEDSLDISEVMKNSPESINNYIIVPQVIDD